MIEIDSLEKRFGGRAALDRISIAFGAGDRVAIIGSNGAGKTTLFRCLLGEYRYSGRIAFGGRGVARRDRAFLARTAFVPQLPPPLRMPVGELIHFSVASAGADRQAIADIASRLGLDLGTVAAQPFHRLSGGQKQKILVTIALARDVDLFIFDEPAANLDPPARAVFIDLLAAARDKTMLIASHRLEEVAPLVNRVVELDQGKVALDDRLGDRLDGGDLQHCEIRLSEPSPAFAEAAAEWGLAIQADELAYSGEVASGDRLRFLTMLARYSARIERLEIQPAKVAEVRPIRRCS